MDSSTEGANSATPSDSGSDDLSTRALQILVVDDDRDAAEVLAELLSAHGHQVEIAYNSLGALESVSHTVPDVAILDIDLPVLDGFRLAERLRARPELSGMRLLAVTGHGGPAAAKRADVAGFHCLFTKPVDTAALLPAFTEPAAEKGLDEGP